jgi:NhaP-type Na+/H+ and K+/H+ antiporter
MHVLEAPLSAGTNDPQWVFLVVSVVSVVQDFQYPASHAFL